MIRISKILLVAAVISLSAAYASSQPTVAELQPVAYGQPDYRGGNQIVTCSSNDGKRNYCNVDTRRGVRLTRQISGSPCIQGNTWGYDNRGLWVDRGCRAEFAVGGGGGGDRWNGGGNNRGGQIITCSSDNGKRNYCQIGGRRDVRLTRQISGSACIRGDTWDVDRGGLWVDRGCRAEFQVR
ncbi:MAG TPA: DUF3011 domain-containing protein [Edaphobacter sp.]|jgi:hypothetical protein|nr:DUF3011 domain-containing protein [Edaphobacter sp.]